MGYDMMPCNLVYWYQYFWVTCCLHTKSVELRSSASQEILRILWKPAIHYHIHKRPPPVPIWIRSIQSIHPPLLLNIHFRIILPYTPMSFKWSLSLRFFFAKTLNEPLLFPYVQYASPSHSSWFVNGIIFDVGYICCLLYHSERVSHLSPSFVGP
jgi:hypothetical protein